MSHGRNPHHHQNAAGALVVAGVLAERAVRGESRTKKGGNITGLMFSSPRWFIRPMAQKLIRNFVRKVAGLTGGLDHARLP